MPVQHQPQPQPQQACDNCRCRKIKCDRGSPCNHCVATALPCQYLHVIRRKGARRGIGRRLAQLKRGQTELDGNYFETLTLDLSEPAWRDERARQSTPQTRRDGVPVRLAVSPPTAESATSRSTAITTTTPTAIEPDSSINSEISLITPISLADTTLLSDPASQNRQLCASLVAHVHVFLKHLFPIMPVIHGDEILADAAQPEKLSPSRYALVLAICAATRIQLKLDNGENSSGTGPGADIPPEPPLRGEMLLEFAENSLRQISVIDDFTLDSTLASFFIFAAHGNLNNPRNAWFYLSQSISLAHALNLTREAGYVDLAEKERETRRRVFWLLFVTERTFALQHRRPVMLRSRVPKPRAVDSDCPVVMHDFLNHIRLFELLPCALYDWDPQGDDYQSDDVSLANKINTRLCAIQADTSFIESQRFDTLITQQWLRVSMWRLAFGTKPSFAYSREIHLPLGLPIDAGKMVMGGLYSAGQLSMDCHGIGMEQKLFDIGVGLADTAQLHGQSFSALEIGPRDLLSTVIKFLSRIRGCESYLLPKLLQHSEHILSLSDPTAHIDAQWSITQQDANLPDWRIVEDFSALTDDLTDKLSWELLDDVACTESTDPYVPSFCEELGNEGE
ncbi:fungal-specific transcription factor domain-containing protein [Dactylonectria estremocensis]|uniref:Fungal-specific transcription factor domain-containing protein n=1 Tax=Dactylonectria estremocensis TaxID=1079267 RepID=A0A9P9EM08_9HYPO|nr:fungal-specific transcription factor domain-containing protein [Dactylonectria estremocensis]